MYVYIYICELYYIHTDILHMLLTMFSFDWWNLLNSSHEAFLKRASGLFNLVLLKISMTLLILMHRPGSGRQLSTWLVVCLMYVRRQPNWPRWPLASEVSEAMRRKRNAWWRGVACKWAEFKKQRLWLELKLYHLVSHWEPKGTILWSEI